MFKNVALGEVKIGERHYQFICSADSPLGEIHDALSMLKGHCVQLMVAEQEKKQEPAPE